MGKRETPEDVARVLSRYADAIVVRTHEHEPLQRFAAASTVPVINGLSQAAHPCQALADMLTIKERFGTLHGLRLAYVGDGRNNMAYLARRGRGDERDVGDLRLADHASAAATRFWRELVELGKPHHVTARAFTSPLRAVRDVDVVYTDVWTSMGDEALQRAQRRRAAALSGQRGTHGRRRAARALHALPARASRRRSHRRRDRRTAQRRLRPSREPHARAESAAARADDRSARPGR